MVMTHTQVNFSISPQSDPVAGVGGRVGMSAKSGISHGKGEGHAACNVSGSAHSCGCMVNGSFAF